jgi:hypothetical protein
MTDRDQSAYADSIRRLTIAMREMLGMNPAGDNENDAPPEEGTRAPVDWSRTMAEKSSALFPSSRWMTYGAAAEQLGLTPGLVAARAWRGRWRTRTRGDTGEAEVEVPDVLLAIGSVEIELEPDLPLRERVAQAVSQVDRAEATRARKKVYAEERAIAKEQAVPSKRPWWLRGWILK